MADLLAPGGRILLELDPPGAGADTQRLRLESDGAASEWFALGARRRSTRSTGPAAAAGLVVTDRWCDGGRWFAEATRP